MYFITRIFWKKIQKEKCKKASFKTSMMEYLFAKSESSIFIPIIVESIDKEENLDKYNTWTIEN